MSASNPDLDAAAAHAENAGDGPIVMVNLIKFKSVEHFRRFAAREPVRLRDHQRVARSHCGEGLIQPRPFALGAADAVIDVDPARSDAEHEERLALSCEVLLVG